MSHRNAGDNGKLVLHGNVDIRQVSLAFEGTGRITRLHVEEGDRVKAGQIIGLLDTRSLEIQAREQEANVEVQRQTLLRLRNGFRPEEIAQSRAQLVSAQASAVRAEHDFVRATRLQANGTSGGAISQQSVDQARSGAGKGR